MKTLFISSAAQIYGSERSLLGLLDEAERMHASVICPPGGTLEAALKKRDIPVYGLEFGRYRFSQRPDWHMRFFWKLYRILRVAEPDVVVINLGAHVPLILLACMLRRIPLVHFYRFEFSPPQRRLDSYCLRKADAIICPARHVQRAAQAWLGEAVAERVHCVYNPQATAMTTPDMRRETRQKLALESRYLVGSFGRLDPLKRLDTLLRALPLIRASFPDLHLIIAGEHSGSTVDKDHMAHLRHLAEQPGCAGAVSFLGYRRDVPQLIASCDVTILPSETECCPRGLVESWSMGVPTVAADIVASREITDASGGGLLFPLGDHDALARCTCQLLADSDRARALGESGQQWIMRACDPAVYGRKVEALLEDVVARG